MPVSTEVAVLESQRNELCQELAMLGDRCLARIMPEQSLLTRKRLGTLRVDQFR